MKDLRLRRAVQTLIATIALLFALTSCDHGWLGDPRLVNRRHDTTDDSSSSSNVSDGEEKVVEEGEIDPFVTGEWNKIDYVFDGIKFDKDDFVLYKVCFDSNNTPEYAFGTGANSTGWTLNDSSTCEYTYDASSDKNTTKSFGTITISKMTVYQYRGKNPLYDANSSYNSGTRMERFRFYRMTGTALVVDLDQYLLAVDTYSKFAFVYGYITDTETKFFQKIPTEYEPVELHGTGDDENRPFYEYDPIGYVEEDGTVVLYDQYKQDMIDSSAIYYMPSIHDGYTAMAKHSSDGEGRSPYYPGLYE